jgi:cysteine desulfurase
MYFDNNATTKVCLASKQALVSWLDRRANASTTTPIAKKAQLLIQNAKNYILKYCNATDHTVVFTSGASESNCLIIRSVVDAYTLKTKTIPHIIISATEHHSVLQCCADLKERDVINITYIAPNAYGAISPQLVERAIQKDTALISIMAANNELGCINDLQKIGEVALKHKIPFHTDAVQMFGKYKINMSNITALSMSFHKIYGPMGVGLLVISNQLIDGYNIRSQISGTQQKALRGGTENLPGIAGAFAALKYMTQKREEKNTKLFRMREHVIAELAKVFVQGDYKSYFPTEKITTGEFVVLGPPWNGSVKQPNVLPSTLLLAFVKNPGAVCNIEMRRCLLKRKVVVSIGSACATSSVEASHVLHSIRAPPSIMRGTLRISFGDDNTFKEVEHLIESLVACVKKQFK